MAGGTPRYPVNVPTVDAETMAVIGPFLGAARLAGRVAMQLRQGNVQNVRIEYRGAIGHQPDLTPLKASVPSRSSVKANAGLKVFARMTKDRVSLKKDSKWRSDIEIYPVRPPPPRRAPPSHRALLARCAR